MKYWPFVPAMLRFKRNKFTIIDLVLRWIEVISVTVNSLVHVYKKSLPFVRSWICLSAWPLYHLHILYQHLVDDCFPSTVHLFYLFLCRVARRKKENMMSEQNLSIVFGPTLMRSPEGDSVDILSDMKAQRLVIETLISWQDILFESSWWMHQCFCCHGLIINVLIFVRSIGLLMSHRSQNVCFTHNLFFIGDFKKLIVNSYNIFIFLLFFEHTNAHCISFFWC